MTCGSYFKIQSTLQISINEFQTFNLLNEISDCLQIYANSPCNFVLENINKLCWSAEPQNGCYIKKMVVFVDSVFGWN